MVNRRLSLLLIASFTGAAGAANDLEPPAIPRVLTPIRLEQPRTEVPASVTVLDAQLIAATGIRELPELFRLVPGMVVGPRDGWNYVVSYHGTTYRDARRMQVLIDGRSVYQAGLATIDWTDIPIAIEDIDRIEVVRGPATSAYGANAFLGVINIITRHPDDSPRLRLKATGGTESTEDYYGTAAGRIGESAWRLSAQSRRDSGFDSKRDGAPRRDSKNVQLVNGHWSLPVADHWQLDLRAGFKTGTVTEDLSEPTVIDRRLPPVLPMTPADISTKDYFFSLQSNHFLTARSSLKWQLDYARQRETADWGVCLPTIALAIPSPAPSDIVCGTTDDSGNNSRTDVDLEYTIHGRSPWKLVTGAHIKRARVHSQTYYDGTATSDSYQLFANYQYRFLPDFSFTVGASQEFQTGQDRELSPRLALHYFPSDNHAFRMVYSQAIRTPDLLENEADWSYLAYDLQPVYNGRDSGTFIQRAQAAGDLSEERITSQELGYYGLWLNRTLQIDIKWFRDELDDLISKQLAFARFNPRNAAMVEQQGIETEIDYSLNSHWRFRATYALIDSETDEPNEEDFTPKASGSAGIIWQNNGWQVSSFYYCADRINSRRFDRASLRLARTLPIATGELTLSATVYHGFADDGELFTDNRYDQPNRGWLAVDLRF